MVLLKYICDNPSCNRLGLVKLEESPPFKVYKYTIKQTNKGAKVTVHGDTIDEIVADCKGEKAYKKIGIIWLLLH